MIQYSCVSFSSSRKGSC